MTPPLDTFLAEWQDREFAWRDANCCTFAAAWVERIVGVNPLHGLRAARNAVEAQRLIESLGGGLMDAVTHQLGVAPTLPTLAQVGDVVLLSIDPQRRAIGICCGRLAAALTEHDGLVYVPMTQAESAWRVAA